MILCGYNPIYLWLVFVVTAGTVIRGTLEFPELMTKAGVFEEYWLIQDGHGRYIKLENCEFSNNDPRHVLIYGNFIDSSSFMCDDTETKLNVPNSNQNTPSSSPTSGPIATDERKPFYHLGPGKCRTPSGDDPEVDNLGSVGMEKCVNLCEKEKNCGGFSVSDEGECLLWLEQELTGGGTEWDGAGCYAKKLIKIEVPRWSGDDGFDIWVFFVTPITVFFCLLVIGNEVKKSGYCPCHLEDHAYSDVPAATLTSPQQHSITSIGGDVFMNG